MRTKPCPLYVEDSVIGLDVRRGGGFQETHSDARAMIDRVRLGHLALQFVPMSLDGKVLSRVGRNQEGRCVAKLSLFKPFQHYSNNHRYTKAFT